MTDPLMNKNISSQNQGARKKGNSQRREERWGEKGGTLMKDRVGGCKDKSTSAPSVVAKVTGQCIKHGYLTWGYMGKVLLFRHYLATTTFALLHFLRSIRICICNRDVRAVRSERRFDSERGWPRRAVPAGHRWSTAELWSHIDSHVDIHRVFRLEKLARSPLEIIQFPFSLGPAHALRKVGFIFSADKTVSMAVSLRANENICCLKEP